MKPVQPNELITAFLNQVCSHIRWPIYCARVRRELTDHILTRAEYLTSQRSFSEQEAVKQAILWLGDPDELGRSLRRAYCPVKKAGFLLLTCIVWIGIAVCAIYLFLHLSI